MQEERYEKSRRFILRGLFLLLFGSASALLCKLPGLPETLGTFAAYAGGCVLLGGNGCIIYGLLIFADARKQ